MSIHYNATVFTYNSNKTPDLLVRSMTLKSLGPGLWWSVERSDVDAGQSEPGQRKLSSSAVILEFDIKVEISGVKEKQGTLTYSTFVGFNRINVEGVGADEGDSVLQIVVLDSILIVLIWHHVQSQGPH